jgi:ribose transport system substrate-binding protein
VLTYDVDFFVTNEREIAFCKWMRAQRQDITLHVVKFPSIEGARQTAEDLLGSQPSLSGLFAVWEAPALRALAALKSRGLELPVTTIDLGNEVAMEMAGGGMIKGIGAQQPYAQGVAAAKAAIGSLLGRPTPEWVALPGLPVTRDNVVESFQAVWRAPAPRELVIRSRG